MLKSVYDYILIRYRGLREEIWKEDKSVYTSIFKGFRLHQNVRMETTDA